MGEAHYNTIDTKAVESMINNIWCADGKHWSSRVWENTERLQLALNDNLIDCLVSGRNPEQLKGLLMDSFNVSYSRADSLVRTEMAHIQTQAAEQRYADAGVNYIEIWADKDERQCELCGKLHRKVYRMGDKLPIPAHPNCRCCILPIVE
jgi:SPP1 gp7 family putative phage head morphogenesis protein